MPGLFLSPAAGNQALRGDLLPVMGIQAISRETEGNCMTPALQLHPWLSKARKPGNPFWVLQVSETRQRFAIVANPSFATKCYQSLCDVISRLRCPFARKRELRLAKTRQFVNKNPTSHAAVKAPVFPRPLISGFSGAVTSSDARGLGVAKPLFP